MRVGSLQSKAMAASIKDRNLNDIMELCDEIPAQCFGTPEAFHTVVTNAFIPGINREGFVLARQDLVTPKERAMALSALAGGYKRILTLTHHKWGTTGRNPLTNRAIKGETIGRLDVVMDDPDVTSPGIFKILFNSVLLCGIADADGNLSADTDTLAFAKACAKVFTEKGQGDSQFSITGSMGKEKMLSRTEKVSFLEACKESLDLFKKGAHNVRMTSGLAVTVEFSRVTEVKPRNFIMEGRNPEVYHRSDIQSGQLFDQYIEARKQGLAYVLVLLSDGTCTTVGNADGEVIGTVILPGLLPADGKILVIQDVDIKDFGNKILTSGENHLFGIGYLQRDFGGFHHVVNDDAEAEKIITAIPTLSFKKYVFKA